MDTLIDADTVGRVDDIISDLQFGQAVDFQSPILTAATRASHRTHRASVGEDGQMGLRQFEAGGYTACHHQHLTPNGSLGGLGIQRRQTCLFQIVRQGLGSFFLTAGQHHAGHFACQQISQILRQQFHATRPNRQLTGVHRVHFVQRQTDAATGEIIHQNGGTFTHQHHQIVPSGSVFCQPATEEIFLQKRHHILLQLPQVGTHSFLDTTGFADNQQGVTHIRKGVRLYRIN